MKKSSILFMLFVMLLGLGVSCNRDKDEHKGREAMEEIGHEADEVGDKMEDAGDELKE
jgi:hypothetical protein